MNKRIKELAYTAKLDEHMLWTSDEGHVLPYEMRKFAELIVAECADACYKHKDVESFGIYPVRVAMVTKACSDNIKKHFGVEE
jgi:hypothetical protein